MDDSHHDGTRDRWQDVDRMFLAALERPESERTRFIDAECGGDWQLREAVLSLLRAVTESEGMFEAPPARALIGALAGSNPAIGGAQSPHIAGWRIIREIGRGGMGTVYLAERDGPDFDQRAAIKVLRRGIDTDDLVRRFVAERRILATLEHPGIATLHEGGATADGRPYFVMEYIEGTPITRYCDSHRLTIRDRLSLFLDVAAAVRHAHTKLVVHRDLKPSNILVTADRHVKLLDFGIAKLLNPDAGADDLTQTELRMLTPDYASPEQVHGTPVTTASDVYQLGLLLWELLTGGRPHELSGISPHEVATVFDRTETLKPSGHVEASAAGLRSSTLRALRARLRGDLDRIVGKALRSSPDQRHESAAELAADVRRFLEGRPVSARPATALYRARKFMGRHRWSVPVLVTTIVFIGVYILTQIRHARVLEVERNEARMQADRAKEVQRVLVDLFRSADPYAPADPERGRAITVVEALDLGLERVREDLADRPAIRASLLDAIATAYENLGVLDPAIAARREALSLQQSLGGDTAAEARASLGKLGRMLGVVDRADTARTLLEERLALSREAVGDASIEVAEARLDLGNFLIAHGQPEEAASHMNAILAVADSLPDAPLSEASGILADAYTILDQFDEAETAARHALALKEKVFGEGSIGAALARVRLAGLLSDALRIDEAMVEFERAIPILESTIGPENGLTLNTLNNLALLKQRAGDLSGAETTYRRLIDARIRAHGPDHLTLGTVYQNLGTVLMLEERFDEAIEMHERADAIYHANLDDDNYMVALPALSMAGIDLSIGRNRRAEREAVRSLSILEAALPAGHAITAVARCRVGRARMAAGNLTRATTPLAEAAAVLADNTDLPRYRAECLDAFADVLELTGHADSAAVVRSRASSASAPGS